MMPPHLDPLGCCYCHCCEIHLNQDNARFLFLAGLMAVYLLCGAAIFSAIEHPMEMENQERWNRILANFSHHFNISPGEFRRFLREYERAMAAGVRMDTLRPRWDFTGAFYFVGTVVSTIGFGMTTPVTATGKIFLIFYGMIGCAGTILFFNLFLERIITLLAVIMRAFRVHQLRMKGVFPETIGGPFKGEEEANSLIGWKPSVYNVLTILGIAALVISCCASATYTKAEGWNYVDSLYFCFVTFSTIGFGDLCCACCKKVHQPRRRWGRQHRFATASASAGRPLRSEVSMDTEAVFESETDARCMSVEMSTIRDFLALTASTSNKAAVTAFPRPQGPETTNGHLKIAWSTHQNGLKNNITNSKVSEIGDYDLQRGLLSDIGSLAVMNNKLAETSDNSCHHGIHMKGTSPGIMSNMVLETNDHGHQNRLSTNHNSPVGAPKCHYRLSTSSATFKEKLEESSGHEDHDCSSGVESLANINDSAVQTSSGESQNGLSSSGIGSSSLLNRAAEGGNKDNPRRSPDWDPSAIPDSILQDLNTNSRCQHLKEECTAEPTHKDLKHGMDGSSQSSVMGSPKLMHSNCRRPPPSSGRFPEPRNRLPQGREEMPRNKRLRDRGTLTVLNQRSAESHVRKIPRYHKMTGNSGNS
ncbi:potassium channel subfamily K member 13-like isoform X2 [Latimeria chalumnae]|uniref:potassium channel subfamily K member 13-like isoform X2 n=1 Tax=Latimeria chalumnae TaxID=7897 RepID=UPI0003C1365D|nr:PREDICTED: potassium channel subfamily K member 13-like isoform X2 [Latimeria chalumnae]|eukprot:XP_014354321.1 PREDICTED: potassium channel subfamily K member 13-like isoform X2 [Latimeria chalumnae]